MSNTTYAGYGIIIYGHVQLQSTQAGFNIFTIYKKIINNLDSTPHKTVERFLCSETLAKPALMHQVTLVPKQQVISQRCCTCSSSFSSWGFKPFKSHIRWQP